MLSYFYCSMIHRRRKIINNWHLSIIKNLFTDWHSISSILRGAWTTFWVLWVSSRVVFQTNIFTRKISAQKNIFLQNNFGKHSSQKTIILRQKFSFNKSSTSRKISENNLCSSIQILECMTFNWTIFWQLFRYSIDSLIS